MTRIRASLTYANVMATIALFVALGGGAYAALKLPKNSVGTKQLKKGAVTGSKVKNGSLAAADFKAGTLPRGPSGPQGQQGQQGTPGLQGEQGVDGSPGRDGAAVAARVRSTGSVDTPADRTEISLPLTSNTWTQAANEVDLLPYGNFKVVFPDSTHCTADGKVDLTLSIYLDGSLFRNETRQGFADSSTHVYSFAPTYLYEPGNATAHTATAKVSSMCDAGPTPAPIKVSDLSFDVIRAL